MAHSSAKLRNRAWRRIEFSLASILTCRTNRPTLRRWPSLNNGFDAPLIIWLQGGPGGSSLFGMFVENGPYSVDANGNLLDNPGSWCGNYSCLYIDNPRGTGYSYTNNGTLCTEWTCYAADLDNALRQVLTAFPQLQAQEVYITGESYAGKWVFWKHAHAVVSSLPPL